MAVVCREMIGRERGSAAVKGIDDLSKVVISNRRSVYEAVESYAEQLSSILDVAIPVGLRATLSQEPDG